MSPTDSERDLIVAVLALSAPHDIPTWFTHTSTRAPQPPDITPPEHLRAFCEDWRRDPCFDLYAPGDEQRAMEMDDDWPVKSPGDALFLRDFQAAWNEHGRASAEWRRADNLARMVQWRAAYAKALYAELSDTEVIP